jgi:lysophospholipase L1-like esterase
MQTKIELKPNWSIVFIGDSITDAGRLEPAYRPFGYGYVHFVAYRLKAKYPEYNLRIINTGISGNEYQLTYKRLLSLVKEKYNCRLILMEPFMFCDDKANPAYRALQQYIHAVRELAEEFDAVQVPLQQLIDETIKKVPPEKFSDDMVHPYVWAHAWIAQQWFEATKL